MIQLLSYKVLNLTKLSEMILNNEDVSPLVEHHKSDTERF